MEKTNLLKEYYKLLCLFYDYNEFGFSLKHTTPNFQYKDKPLKPAENKPKKPKRDIIKKEISVKRKEIIEIAEKIIQCRQCILHTKSNKVCGIGNVDSKIFVISAPPSIEEENAGKPLVGETGPFFNKWLSAININPEEIFITNIIKCCPKAVRLTKEIFETCITHLEKQLDTVQPQIILCLGQAAVSSIYKKSINLNTNHGKISYYNSIPVISTFHPKEVLINQNLKKLVWQDLKILEKFLKDNSQNE